MYTAFRPVAVTCLKRGDFDAAIPCFGKRKMARTGFKLNRALTMVPRDKTSRLVVGKKRPQPYLLSLACTSICFLKFFMAGVLE